MGLIKNMEPEQVLNLAQQVAVRPRDCQQNSGTESSCESDAVCICKRGRDSTP